MGLEPSKPSVKSSHGTTASYTRQPRYHMIQNYLLLWTDMSIDHTNEDYENALKQIRTITRDVNVFTQRDACIDYLTDLGEDIKSFLVVKDTMFQQIMPLINDIPQLNGVYIFDGIETLHEEWTTKWQKIKTVQTNIDDLCHELKIGINQFNHDSITMSFLTLSEMASTDNLNQLEPNFMYTQVFKEILLDMQHGKQAIKQFIAYCKNNNSLSSININHFEQVYHAQSAVWWYTFPSNIYHMLNYSLRTLDADAIITMGFLMCHLHQQIQQLYEQQLSTYGKETFIVYRGQGLMKSDFEKLQKAKGGLISFNSFLSTSTNKEVSVSFARFASAEPNTVGILFMMSIDPNVKSVPFASIKEVSYFKEEDEILFSMHTVFRMGAIKKIDNNNQLYQVELQLTSNDDQQLRLITDRIREKTVGNTGWQRLGSLLLQIGQFNKAEELYNILLEQTSDEGGKQYYYNQLGSVKCGQGDYEKAISYYEKGLEIKQKLLRSKHPSLANSYNNIGHVYYKMTKYWKALSFFEKALENLQETLPSNHLLWTTSYSYIGSVYIQMGKYSEALSFFEKALEIKQKALPSNHPDFAQSYNNIGLAYDGMGEFSKTFSFYEKALEIKQKTLPSNHPDLAISYKNIGNVYDKMSEYSKALSFYEKVLEIQQKTLPSNHLDFAQSYNNIGWDYRFMEDYSKALSYYERALNIYQHTLPETDIKIKLVKTYIEAVKKKL
ncbi:unnamed protein product [Adineta steineri]|uniref:NAD(P)(+)--arginine ADP-ribosyltransferase n=1 Tax=Adineta steineri TaxID=433720 RepID=A0A815A0P5_9BILA|nr:unnamed protein product [Adineta steineri]CAF1532769.1 unnamed protein product [Adineta steineri]